MVPGPIMSLCFTEHGLSPNLLARLSAELDAIQGECETMWKALHPYDAPDGNWLDNSTITVWIARKIVRMQAVL